MLRRGGKKESAIFSTQRDFSFHRLAHYMPDMKWGACSEKRKAKRLEVEGGDDSNETSYRFHVFGIRVRVMRRGCNNWGVLVGWTHRTEG